MDTENPIFFNMSGIYQKQEFYQEAVRNNAYVVQGTAMKGTDCYCDDEAVRRLEEAIKKHSPKGIHYIDSGNYHYISYLWLKKIEMPLELILFDHHPDMQHSLFGDILSCGGWVESALKTCGFLKRILCIGVNEQLLSEEMINRSTVTFLSKQQLEQEDVCGVIQQWLSMKEDHAVKELPVYISIDKDVLSEEVVKTNWDQGTMQMETLLTALQCIFGKRRVIGMDICGEPFNDENVSEEELKKSSMVNSQFMYFINNLEKNQR